MNVEERSQAFDSVRAGGDLTRGALEGGFRPIALCSAERWTHVAFSNVLRMKRSFCGRVSVIPCRSSAVDS